MSESLLAPPRRRARGRGSIHMAPARRRWRGPASRAKPPARRALACFAAAALSFAIELRTVSRGADGA
eukprot:14192424-Alexandrium_andersonii.AAC.1